MAKFHISPKTGLPSECKAQSGKCPYGADSEHFTSAEEAQVFLDTQNANNFVNSEPSKK